jgi:hypothetical protein
MNNMNLHEFEQNITDKLFTLKQKELKPLIETELMTHSNPIQIHVRIKNGINSKAEIIQKELNSISNMYYLNDNSSLFETLFRSKCHELIVFYTRIVTLVKAINEYLKTVGENDDLLFAEKHITHKKFKELYEMQKEKKMQKRENNEKVLNEILNHLLTSSMSCIHPELNESSLASYEQRANDIFQRKETLETLRCVQIIEAAVEEQVYDELIKKLDTDDNY